VLSRGLAAVSVTIDVVLRHHRVTDAAPIARRAAVIPERSEGSNPESRGSGFVAWRLPGTTAESIDKPDKLAQKAPARGPVSAREAFRDPWSCP
jgi:hypothetical protein